MKNKTFIVQRVIFRFLTIESKDRVFEGLEETEI